MILNIRRHIATHGLRGFALAQLAADIVAPTLERNIRARFTRHRQSDANITANAQKNRNELK
ncbi:MAG: hypothetical protein RJR34_13065 [Candidatus Methanoculleus thermohydrogenotrophicum]|nr:hypothetical protein [Candidatus Methanoculleus thermohydrogenotrophicum]